MSDTQLKTPEFNFAVLLPGILAALLGGVSFFGWAFDYPVLSQFNPDWKPMVPSTALCFVLAGISLIANHLSPFRWSAATQRICVWLIIFVAGARGIELVSGFNLGIGFLVPLMGSSLLGTGQMSPQTVAGLLMFGFGMVTLQRAGSRWGYLFVNMMARTLLLCGLLVLIGYWLDFQIVFETLYIKTGLIWMSFPTALGMFLLGLGLECHVQKCRQRHEAALSWQQADRLYRTSLWVLSVTAVTTGMIGISFLQETVLKQSSVNMSQMLNASRSHIDTTLEDLGRHALVASLNPVLKAGATHLIRNPEHGLPSGLKNEFTQELLAHGFSAIAVESGERSWLVSGQLPSERMHFIPLKGKTDAALAWDQGYYLRVRIPVDSAPPDGKMPPGSYLVFDLRLARLDRLFEDSNQWGETGALAMCSRLDRRNLFCFPQREQAGTYVIPDNYRANPIPAALALSGKTDAFTHIDYRGRKVMAAYGPIGDTGLGLVVKMDIAEIYMPIKRELLTALPLILVMIMSGLWLIRLRVQPLAKELAMAHTAERAAKERFHVAMQNSPDGFVIYDSAKNSAGEIVDFRCAYMNPAAEKMIKEPGGKLAGSHIGGLYLQTFPDRVDVFEKFRKVALTGEILQEETLWHGSHDTISTYLRQAVHMPQGIAVTYRDITLEKDLLKKLEYSKQLRTAIVESAAYMIISTDVNGTITSFNQAAERMLWYRAEELVGKTSPEIFHDSDEVRSRAEDLSHELGRSVSPGFEVFVAKAKTDIQEDREWTYIRKDGSRFPVRLSVTALRNDKGELQGFLGIAYDISEQKRAEEYIRHIALHDALTGLPNRALLNDRVTVAIERQRRTGKPFAMAMLDIDHFKHINDSMGHHIGDTLLQRFVERVQSCLRPTDTLARMGGDEFVLLLTESNVPEAEIVMQRIMHALKPPINIGLEEIHITTSVGISLFPGDGESVHELLRCADVAMYRVKAHGRNGFKFFSREMDSGGAARLRLERDLHFALDNNGFSLFYQPIVDLKSGRILGVEALLRMNMANGKFTSPAEFIPLAEDTGLIIPIGHWALKAACKDAARMRGLLGKPLKVAVNLSPRQFMDGNLVSTIKDALDQSRLDASLLDLEITESVLMEEHGGVTTALFELDELGVKIAIDDFGTGYSSLSYLRRYPISKLKIDQSFTHDIAHDPGDAALIAAIIAMGKGLNIPVIAEGIETEEQLDILVSQGCDQGQGFYIGHPMPLDAILQWFQDNPRWTLDEPSDPS